MDLDIRAGKRVLYKEKGSNWLVGELAPATAALRKDGLYLPVYITDELEYIKQYPHFDPLYHDPEIHRIHINDIFFDAFPIEDWIKDYPKYFMTKEDYIKFIESDEFDKRLENACVSDGEYGYYPVSKYSHQWLEKQPFEYIIRSD